ncbi:MAG: hypothetical protein J6A69_10420 [Clostridia bacterium]|nr:hypothetical protein [Clostridia bacterium]
MIKNKLKIALVTMVLCICVVATYIANAQIGSDSDPVISLSYLKQVFQPEITEQMSFKVVSLENGHTLECSAGAELILRMGTANIVATTKGGLADVTAGYDLQNGASMPANHHLIVPVGDGRGVKATSDCLVMVKGEYEIK